MNSKRKQLFIPVDKFTEIKGKGVVVFVSSITKCGHSLDPIKTNLQDMIECWFEYDDENNGKEKWEIVSIDLSRELTTRGMLKDSFGLICKLYKR